MIRVYLASSDKLPAQLTIIASDYNAADLILIAWIERHWPQAVAAATKFKLLSATELALQPQLADAAGAGVSGVGYWVMLRPSGVLHYVHLTAGRSCKPPYPLEPSPHPFHEGSAGQRILRVDCPWGSPQKPSVF